MDGIVAWCIRHRFVVIFAVLVLGVLGVRAARELPVDAVPDVTNVQVQILTNSPSLGPVEVEQYITAPVELAMGGLPRVDEVRSLSRYGLSVVTVVFEEGTDRYFARQLVAERLSAARAAIPATYGEPELGPLSTGLGEVYQFEVRGEPMCGAGEADTDSCYTLMELRTLLDWYVALQLRPLPGVVEVNAFGGELKTYEVRLDPAHMEARKVTLQDVYRAIEANNASAGGGTIEGGGEQRVIRGEALIGSVEELGLVRVATGSDGAPVFIRDVGEVALAPMLRQGAVTRDGRGEVVTGTVMMLVGARSGAVADAVRARLDEIKPGLPPGVTIEATYDRAELVDRTIRTVATNLIEGGVLVIVVLLLFLGNVRGGLLVASVIPLAMLGTLGIMRLLGLSGDLMSLGALDFGLIIDGAIVVVEQSVRAIGAARARGGEVRAVVRRATAQVMRPVLFGTAIIMIVYVPILSLQGIEGKMFRPMAIVVLSALAMALVLAITLVPASATWLFASGVRDREPALARAAHAVYAPLLARAFAWRGAVLGLALAGVVAGGVLASRMGAEFIPTLDEGAIAMQAVRPPSVSLGESVAATTRIEQALREAFPDEIDTIVSRTGRAEIATDPMGVDLSDIYIMLKPPERWTRAKDKAALVARIKQTLEAQVPGQNYAFSQPIELRTNELISGSRADVAVSLYGPDLDELGRLGDEIMQVVRKTPGAADVSADQVSGLPSVRVQVDRQALARYGLDASQVLDAVAALGGRPSGVILEGQRRFDVQVRWSVEVRRSPETIRALRLRAPGGGMIPLGQVARVTLDEGPSVISRESAQRRRVIQVNVRGRDLAGFVAEARERVREQVKLPPGYAVGWGGQFENLKEASARLAVAVPVALALIFLLLYTMFGAARPAIIIYGNIPVAAVGGVLALWARGMPLSISAAVGFIALSGIAVLNGVVMVDTIRHLQQEGMALAEASAEGAKLRLRAVLMTAMTDGLGFLPMALSTTAGAEVQRPLATVVLGGLVTATTLTLLVLPVAYSMFGGALPTPEDAPTPAQETPEDTRE